MLITRPAFVLVLGLSLTSGFTDLITLVRFKQFAGLQTGNMMFIGQNLYQLTLPDASRPELLKEIAFHVATLVSHFAGVVLFCAVAYWSTFPVCAAAPLVAALTILAAVTDILTRGNDWSVCFVSASLGAMNFIPSPNSQLAGKLFIMTTLTTGNLQKCAKMFFKFISCQKFTAQEREQTCNAATTVFSTIFGAMLGALALASNPFGAEAYTESWFLLPVACVQFCLLLLHDRTFRPRSSPDAAPDFQQEASTSLSEMPQGAAEA